MCKSFWELTPQELYQLLEIRNRVFVLEQQCIYQDCDGKDQDAIHLYAYSGTEVLAYCRLLPPGLSYPDAASIGRVLTSPQHRKSGFGKQLMQKALEEIEKRFGKIEIVISAQIYLLRFYQSFDFVAEGDIYQEDAIDHIRMRRAPVKKTLQ